MEETTWKTYGHVGKKLLKYILNKYRVRTCGQFQYMGLQMGSCEHGNEHSYSIKKAGNTMKN